MNRFGDFSPSVRAAICELLGRSHDIIHVDISAMLYVSPMVFSHTPPVKHLTLLSITSRVDESIVEAPAGSICPTRLDIVSGLRYDHTQLNGIIQLLQRKNSPLSFSKLETLIITPPSLCSRTISLLLTFLHKQILRSIALRCPDDAMRPHCELYRHISSRANCPPIDLDAYHRLNYFELWVQIESSSDTPVYESSTVTTAEQHNVVATPLRWVASVLQSLPVIDAKNKPHLRIRLQCSIVVVSVHHISLIPWELLAQALISKQKDFKEVNMSLAIRLRDTPSTPPPHVAVNALKCHPGLKMLDEVAKIQYTTYASDVLVPIINYM